jgi:hypothetical protein
MSLLASAAVLALPASASAFSGTYTGDFAGDTSPDYSLTFTARAHFAKPHQRGKLVPTKVRDFEATVQFTCFDAAGLSISTARRDDLAPGFFDGLKVSKTGRFSGTSTTPTGLTYIAAGRLGLGNQGWATGSLQITQGQKGSDGYCSTGTFADPTTQWKARFLPNVCCAQPQVTPKSRRV